MKKMDLPDVSLSDVIYKVVEGVTGDSGLRYKLVQGREEMIEIEKEYSASGQLGELFTMSPIAEGDESSVIGELTNADLIKLYKNYFAKKSKPAREIYNKIMVSANEKCPFCGGIGRPRNLDHYLPKAHFPQFSIVPINLIPACRDCNMDGKGEVFANSAGEQVLHPYLDDECFYKEQWIVASCNVDNDEIGVISYRVLPPSHWSESDKLRVHQHFEAFDIAKLYSREAAARLHTTVTQIKDLICRGVNERDAKEIILASTIANTPFVNHWERLMCLALYEYQFSR